MLIFFLSCTRIAALIKHIKLTILDYITILLFTSTFKKCYQRCIIFASLVLLHYIKRKYSVKWSDKIQPLDLQPFAIPYNVLGLSLVNSYEYIKNKES